LVTRPPCFRISLVAVQHGGPLDCHATLQEEVLLPVPS